MANTKISALTSATTPLAGTEVLPIVQSSATVKVATNDLTVRNVRANATTGILQVTGPAAASTRVVTVPDANWTAARTDAPQSFTGSQTLATGNLIQGTAGNGVNFTANTPLAGKTTQLLGYYEEGTYTGTITPGTSGTITVNSGINLLSYTRIGRLMYVTGLLRVSAVSSPVGTEVYINLPTNIANGNYYTRFGGGLFYFGAVASIVPYIGNEAENYIRLSMTASTIASGHDFRLDLFYITV